MQCVSFDADLPNGFAEHFVFTAQIPYTINIKKFQTEDVVPLHYAETIEVLLCDGLCGEIVVDNQHYALSGRQLFVVPPYTIHANRIRPGAGTMYVLKISFREMERYLNIPGILALRGVNLQQLQYLCPEYDAAMATVEELIHRDGDLMACLPLILELFLLLSRHADPHRNTAHPHNQFRGSSLQELIRWTNEHYAEKITIDQAASLCGYSRYHFCARFKALTGMTYMHYLGSVRVSQACLMLQNGESVQTVSRSCGFENVSHFIQSFKKIQNTTPYRYAAAHRRQPS